MSVLTLKKNDVVMVESARTSLQRRVMNMASFANVLPGLPQNSKISTARVMVKVRVRVSRLLRSKCTDWQYMTDYLNNYTVTAGGYSGVRLMI